MRSDEQVLGQYVLLERIGHGGMSEVYHARHTSAGGQDVAIKIIRTDLADDRIASRRFQREALALSQLSHPHILSLLAWGEDEGRLYLVLPWVREGTLSHFLKTAAARCTSRKRFRSLGSFARQCNTPMRRTSSTATSNPKISWSSGAHISSSAILASRATIGIRA